MQAYQELQVCIWRKVHIVWIMTTRQLVNIYRRFGGACVSRLKSLSILFFLDYLTQNMEEKNLETLVSINLQVRHSPAG